jgi:hypothetical protein
MRKKLHALSSVSLSFLACSGATTQDLWGSGVLGEGLNGPSGDHGEPLQLGDLGELRNAKIVTVTVGGDDLDFSDIIYNCIDSLLHSCDASSNDGWIADLKSNIQNKLPRLLVSTYRTIESEAPHAALYVVGYPDLFPMKATAGCQGLSKSAVQYLSSMQGYLNTVMGDAATTAGAHYVDPNIGKHSFIGHDICELNGNWFNKLNVIGHTGDFHPNLPGQQALAESLEAAISSDGVAPTFNTSVLLFGDNDSQEGNPSGFTNIAAALRARGLQVTEDVSLTLPSDYQSYGQIWFYSYDPPSSADYTSLETYVIGGGGLFLSGEWGPTGNFANAGVQAIVQDVVSPNIGVSGDKFNAVLSVNSGVIDSVSTNPNSLTTWTPSEEGSLTNVAPANVLFAGTDGDASGAVWSVGVGRLAVLMDINWAQTSYEDASTMPEVAQNIAAFLGSENAMHGGPVGVEIADLAESYDQDSGEQVVDRPSGSLCNPFSGIWGDGSSAGCPSNADPNVTSGVSRSANWCADFAAWVWHLGGAHFTYKYGVSGDLSGDSSSFYYYGMANSTWHPLGDGYTPQPGDVAVYGSSPTTASHVGIYVSDGSGSVSSPDVVNGNWPFDGQYGDNPGVFLRMGESDSGSAAEGGEPLLGYVSPV